MTQGFDSAKCFELFLDKNARSLDRFGVLRAKGFLFVAQDDRVVLEFSKSGPNLEMKAVGVWVSQL
jgi:G3E family GTPase